MNKIILAIIIVIIIATLELSIIYFYEDNMITQENLSQINQQTESTSEVRVGVSDSIDVSVKRPRFYGTIYEQVNSKTSTLHLFNLIKIPLKKNNIDFTPLHIGTGILITGILLLGIMWHLIEKKKYTI